LVIKEYFNRYRQKGVLPPLLEGRIQGKLAKIPLNLNYIDESSQLKIVGRLDECIESNDGALVPLDHKTRAKIPEGVSYSRNYYQTQADTYSLLLQRNGYKTDNKAYIVYYSPSPGELHEGFPFQVEIHCIDTQPETAYVLYREAQQCLGGGIPDFNENCEFCKWGKTSTHIENEHLPES
jgi:hypothetical protein